MEKDTLIVIPTYNEIKSLKKILLKIFKKYNLLIIDDNSNDGTINFLKKKRINFIKNKKNNGYEKTVLKGLNYVCIKKFKYVITFDSDGEHDIKDLPRIIKKVKQDKYDLVISNRNRKNRIMEKFLSLITELRFNLSDPISGFKIYNVNKLKEINFKNEKKLYLTDLVFFFIKKRYKICNIDIVSKKRLGQSKVGTVFSTNIKIFYIAILFLFSLFKF